MIYKKLLKELEIGDKIFGYYVAEDEIIQGVVISHNNELCVLDRRNDIIPLCEMIDIILLNDKKKRKKIHEKLFN